MQTYFEDDYKVQAMIFQVSRFILALRANHEFNAVVNGELSATNVREDYIFGTVIMLESLGVVANVALDNFIMQCEVNWDILDFSKSVEHWNGRVLTKGS